jgi:heme A synthase
MALLGWGLMTLGAFVRASESGLGCPDWPSCHGQLVVGGHHATIEELHRWLAAMLTIGVIGLAVAVFRSHRHEPRLTRPVIWVLALLGLQVALGGVTVVLNNVSWTVVVHYGAAALLVASITLLAVRLASPSAERAPRDSFSRLIGWFVALSFGLLLAGSTVANTDSHTSCGRGFPLCNEALFPALDHHVVINLTHRIWAPVMLVFAVWAVSRSRRDRADSPAIVRAATTVATLFFIEAAIGIDVVVFGQNRAVEVLHSSIASLTWLALMALLSLTWTMPHRGARIEGQGQLSRLLAPVDVTTRPG